MSSISSVQAGNSAQASALASRPPVVAAQAQQRQGAGGSAEVVAEKISRSRSVAAPSVQESAAVTRESVEAAAEKIRSFASSMNRDLDIRFDTSNRSTVMIVTDPQSNEVVRQIPAPEVVELARTIDYLSSLFVSQKA
jgi:flagellar protein FlaG